MSQPSTHSCAQDACTVHIDGGCLEGLPLNDCPHHIAGDERGASEAGSGTVTATTPNSDEIRDTGHDPEVVKLFSGEELGLDDARSIMARSLTQLVVILGAPDSGKTTLLASLWDLFQRGPFAGYLFAGSQTQPAFERRCHLSRTESGLPHPDTERTMRSDETRLLHMAVRDEELRRPAKHILLSDIAGERLEDVRVSTDEAKRLTLLKRADHIVLLLDGERLVSLNDRHLARNASTNLLRSLLDAEVLGPNHYVEVLVSKWDIVTKTEDADSVRFVKETLKDIVDRFGSRFSRLHAGRIAARPNSDSDLTFGFGVEERFRRWVDDTRFIQNPKRPEPDRKSVV